MAEVKPTMDEERRARLDLLITHGDTRQYSGPGMAVSVRLLREDVAALSATLAAVEKELAEAQRDATFGSDEFRAQYEALQVAHAASQATVKELREALDGVRPFIQEDFPDEDVNHPGACVTDRYRAAAIAMVRALARTDDMGALEAWTEKAVAAGFIGGRKSTAVCGGRQTLNEKAAIVARLMRRAGETT